MGPRASLIGASVALTFGAVSAHAATLQITIDKLTFAPVEVSAKVGDTIEWTNKDVVAHTATARSKDWDVNIPAGKGGKLQLKKPGTVEYYCRFHPNMTGRVTVNPE